MVHQDPMPLLSVVTDVPWQIINKKKEKEVKIETTSIQSGFVAAKGSVPVKSEQMWKLEEAEILSTCVKKTKTAQMIIGSDNSFSPSGLVGLWILYEIWSTDTKTWTIQGNKPVPSQVTVCPFPKIYEWSGQLWNCQTLSDMNFTLRLLISFPVEPEAQVFSFSINNSCPSQFCSLLKSWMYSLWIFWIIHWW